MRRIRIDRNGRAPLDEGNDEFYGFVEDLVHHPVVLEMKRYPHHGTTSCYQHCLNVAYYNYRICRYFGWDARAAARAGMLHDLFLYDWHTHAARTGDRFHGLTHPKVALANAEKYFKLSNLEKEIILRHMFPVTLVPPKHKEAFVICFSDKYCGSCETAGGRNWREFLKYLPLNRKLVEVVFGQDYTFRDYTLQESGHPGGVKRDGMSGRPAGSQGKDGMPGHSGGVKQGRMYGRSAGTRRKDGMPGHPGSVRQETRYAGTDLAGVPECSAAEGQGSSVNAAKGGDFTSLRTRPGGKWKHASRERRHTPM